ncbi:hypothetical protein ACROYT_G039651 [Oculina patagonica]
MAAELTDETASKHKYPSNQTLFPILGSERVSKPNWLRNESYKDIISFESDHHETTNSEERQYSPEQDTQVHPQSVEPGSKRALVDISSSDEERELHHGKEIKKEHSSTSENVRKHHKDKKRHKHKKKHKHKREKSEVKEHISEDVGKPDTIWIEEAHLAPEKAFRLHKKPDLANRMYNTLYRLDIALYKMRSDATCLGLSKHQVIELSEQKGKKKKKMKTVARYWNIKDYQVPESTDNISLTLPTAMEKPDQGVNLGDVRGYLSLETPRQDEIAKGDLHRGTLQQSNADQDSHESDILQKTRELNKTLHNNPHDIQTWLALIDFQEEIVQTEDSVKSSLTATGREKRKAATRTVIEKKIAVFEKALQKNPNSVELIVGHLGLCNEIMDAEELAQKWKRVSFVHPNNTLLWRHYLLFMQSRFSVFSFSKAAAVYGKCLSTLSSIKEGTFASHQAEGDLESEMLDLFIRQCQFTRQSGHTEKAVACLQAMVELNCFCSPDLEKNTPVTGQMAFLETFWDSGQPRFGEDGASGWKSWMAAENRTVTPVVAIDIKKIFKADSTSATDESNSLDDNEEEIVVDKDQPLWKNWVKVELSRQRRHLSPWQPDAGTDQSEEDCDDAERLVLFEDISSSLFKINDPRNKLKLVLTFLKLLEVSVPCASSSTNVDIQRFLNISLEHESQLLEPNSFTTSQFLGLRQSYHWDDGNSTDTTDKQWPSLEALALVRNIFVQILPVFEGATRSFLMVLWLWFEFGLTQKASSLKESKKKYKDVRKLAKSLLKQPENRNDLKLWQAFAEIEWLSGNTDEACRVFDSTLMMGGEMFSDEQSRRTALAPLVRSYAELEVGVTENSKVSQHLSGEDNKKALQILTTFAEGAKFQPSTPNSSTMDVSAVRLLKSRTIYQKLHQGIVETTESSQEKRELLSDCGIASGSLAVHLEACSALFEYLSTGIQGVLSMCKGFISVISHAPNQAGLSEMDTELILSFYIRLFRFHCKSSRTLPMKDTRDILHFALEKFPDNSEFLSFYIQRESKSILTGEVRRKLDKATQKATTPVPWIFAIHYEQLRAKSLVSVMECNDPFALIAEGSSAALTSLPVTGVVHRQCSLFERAVTSSSGRHCVALWRMFMEFQSKHGQEKVKSVFYQALQDCPWAKVLYMDAVQKSPDDIQDIVDLMIEKEIRLHAPLEEIELLLQE